MTQQNENDLSENTPEGREKRRQATLRLHQSVKKTKSIRGRTVAVTLGGGNFTVIEVAEIDPNLLEVRQNIRLSPKSARELARGLDKAAKISEVSSPVGKKY